MNRQHETDDLAEQAHRINFAAAARGEQEQAAWRQAAIQTTLPWLVALIWFAIGAVLFGGGVFVGWLAWHYQPASG